MAVNTLGIGEGDNQMEGVFSDSYFNLTIPPAIEKLPPPLNEHEIAQIREERGLMQVTEHVYAPDGIFAAGWDLENENHIEILTGSIQQALETVNTVHDEHFKQKTMLDLALLKQLWFELNDNELKVSACFRFTIDDCDAGRRMMDKVSGAMHKELSSNLSLKVIVETIHGGSEWSVEEVQEEGLKEVLKEALSAIKKQ